ncbi:unnamed protein product [Leptosia nina]|uniref:OAR domain-containing protein n=1 Tax=Leptosia nina TaxID=320188 RepID=A0AAV1K660_9NEOP
MSVCGGRYADSSIISTCNERKSFDSIERVLGGISRPSLKRARVFDGSISGSLPPMPCEGIVAGIKYALRECRSGATPRPPFISLSPISDAITGAYRSSPAGSDAPPAPPLFLPPHLSHLSQHLNHLSQPFFPLKGWGAPCPCCPKEEARSSSVAELRRKAHEHSAALLQSLANFQSRALLPLPLHLPPLPLSLLPHDSQPPTTQPEQQKHVE